MEGSLIAFYCSLVIFAMAYVRTRRAIFFKKERRRLSLRELRVDERGVYSKRERKLGTAIFENLVGYEGEKV